MVNEVPCEVPRPKTREACGPSGFSLGTSLGSPFSMNPLGFSTNSTTVHPCPGFEEGGHGGGSPVIHVSGKVTRRTQKVV